MAEALDVDVDVSAGITANRDHSSMRRGGSGLTVGLMALIASVGGLLFGYETAGAAGALDSSDFPWGSAHQVQSTATLLGAIVGAVFAGKVSDRVGRRDVIMVTSALFTTGAFVGALAPSVEVLFVGRLVVGIAIGAICVVSPVYIAEIAPKARRGGLICVFQLMITVGILAGFLVNQAIGGTPDSWRWILVGGAVPGLILSVLALFLVESPVWLAIKGDQPAALAALDRLGRRGSEYDIASIEPQDGGRSGELASVVSLAGRTALFICVGLFFVQQFVGINAVIYYTTASMGELAELLHLGRLDTPGVPIAVLNVLATLVPLFLVDRVGRRPLLIVSLLGIVTGLAAMAGAAVLDPSSGAAHILSLAGPCVFIASFAIGLGPISWIVASEILPISARGLAMSGVVASQFFFDSLATPTGQLLDGGWSRPALLLVYAGVALGGLAIFSRVLPETKGISLAAINRYITARANRVRSSNFVNYSVAGLAALGGVLAGYNWGALGVTLVLINDDWKLDAFRQGVLASALLVGSMAGSFLAGPISDRVGRRYTLMSTAALFVASAFGAAVSPSLGWLLVARIGTGVAMGISGAAIGLYVAEVAPAAIRGRMLSFSTVAMGVGALLAYCAGLALQGATHGWRVMFGLFALPAAVYGLALLPLPESPRWLASTGQLGAARRSLLQLVGVTRDREAEADRQLALITATEPDSMPDHAGERRGWAQLWQPTHRPALLVGLAIEFLFVFSGEVILGFYAPTILTDMGFGGRAVAFAVPLGIGAVGLTLTLITANNIDRTGRKPLMVLGLFAMAVCLVGFAALSISGNTDVWVRWGQIGCLVGLGAAFSVSVGMVGGIVTSEIYPQSIRGPAASLLGGVGGVIALSSTLTFPLLLENLGLPLILLTYAVIDILGATYLLWALPETKGKSLEELAAYWRRRVATSEPKG
ncbi:MAG: sugar porter family MFS transporter [Mycobacterium sp.]